MSAWGSPAGHCLNKDAKMIPVKNKARQLKRRAEQFQSLSPYIPHFLMNPIVGLNSQLAKRTLARLRVFLLLLPMSHKLKENHPKYNNTGASFWIRR